MFGMPEASRHITISDEINEHTAREFISQLNEINQMDLERRLTIINYKPQPIQVYINSGGGSVTDGFAIISAMEMSETPIITYGMGLVASMALAIFVAGDIRIASRFTRFMYHSISYGMMGHITEHEAMREEADILQRMYDSLMLEKTNLTKDQLKKIREMKENFYFGAVKAKKQGIADEIIDKPEKRIELPTEEEMENALLQLEKNK
jgi:ATP-dependent Clp protease protease subunit